MEIEIKDSKENPLVGRKEYFLEISHQKEATPSKDKIISKFSAENDEDQEKIQLGSINTDFGIGFSRVKLKVFDEKIREIEQEDEEGEPNEEEKEE